MSRLILEIDLGDSGSLQAGDAIHAAINELSKLKAQAYAGIEVYEFPQQGNIRDEIKDANRQVGFWEITDAEGGN